MAKRNEMICWARYLSWCEFLKKDYDALPKEDQEPQPRQGDPWHERAFAAMSYWYASLHVVIEGWSRSGYTIRVIDALLGHEGNFKSLLKRYRNATFHFSPDLADARVTKMIDSGERGLLGLTHSTPSCAPPRLLGECGLLWRRRRHSL